MSSTSLAWCQISRADLLPIISKHLKKHTRPYKCTIDTCNLAFKLQSGLDVASEGTKRKENLSRHVKDANKEQQPP